jgi:hypothetical protein
MTVATAPGQTLARSGSLAEPGRTWRLSVPERLDRWTRQSIWLVIVVNMLGDRWAEARETSERPAEPVPREEPAEPREEPAEPAPKRRLSFSQRMDHWTRQVVWLMIVAKMPSERRFQTGVITGVIGALALSTLAKDNQARPVRRALAWYNVHGQIQEVKELAQAVDALKPVEMLEAATTRSE